MVQAATAEAERLLTEARKQAQDLMERARAESRIEAGQILAKTEEQALLEKAKRVETLTAQINNEVRFDESVTQQVVDAAVRCICGAS